MNKVSFCQFAALKVPKA